jgi:hypothetical protein
MKLPGWEEVTSAEQYRQMIEEEYYALKAQRTATSGVGVGLEEIKLRLFLSLIEKPNDASSAAQTRYRPQVVSSAKTPFDLLQNDQATSD